MQSPSICRKPAAPPSPLVLRPQSHTLTHTTQHSSSVICSPTRGGSRSRHLLSILPLGKRKTEVNSWNRWSLARQSPFPEEKNNSFCWTSVWRNILDHKCYPSSCLLSLDSPNTHSLWTMVLFITTHSHKHSKAWYWFTQSIIKKWHVRLAER